MGQPPVTAALVQAASGKARRRAEGGARWAVWGGGLVLAAVAVGPRRGSVDDSERGS